MTNKLRITVTATVAALAIVAAACGSSDRVDKTAETFTPDLTIGVGEQQPLAEEVEPGDVDPGDVESDANPVPPPSSFSEVDPAFEAATNSILEQGRAVADELVAGDAAAIHAKFDAAFQAQLSQEEMVATLAELTSQAPLKERGADRAHSLSSALQFYQAELGWGEGIMTITASFNEAGEISGLLLAPQTPLPADPAAEYESTVEYRLPFDGLWYVAWGGDTVVENYHVVSRDQRHAFDIMVWKDGATHAGDGSANEDYWAYGQPVLAPAGGTVVTAVDGLPDQAPQTETDTLNSAGNHLVIEVADGEYVLIAHMQSGSLTVAKGDVVVSGQQIGLVGNSGNTSEPHIHIHAQDRAIFDPMANGLPLDFAGYAANGTDVEVGRPVGGQFVAHS